MKLSKYGYYEIIHSEAVGLTKYLDNADVETISAGVTKTEIPDLASWSWSKKITLDEAMHLYRQAMRKYEAIVDKAIKVDIQQHQYDALVSIAYNIGGSKFATSTFAKRINNKDSLDNIKRAIMLFIMSTDPKTKKLVVNQGLVNRRTREADLYVNGTYNNKEGVASVVPIINKRPKYNLGKKVNISEYFKDIDKKEEIIKEPPFQKVETKQTLLSEDLVNKFKNWVEKHIGKL